MRVHPIQTNYTTKGNTVTCGLCGEKESPKNSDTKPRVTYVVHLVKNHIEEVNKTFSPEGRAEEFETEDLD